MKRYLLPISAFLFPLLYYFRFVYPNSALLLLQNDFGWLYFVYKGYLADSIAHGHFPLWSPAEAGGYAFFGNPFTAPLYPLNILPIVTRLLVGNYNYWFHQIFTVLGVCLFAVGFYRWLNQTYQKPLAALFTSITLAACWSMGEFMRFPNAIHAIAWMPWVLSAIQSAHRSHRSLPVYGGMCTLFCQITAGYPYFVVYCSFLYAGYIAYLHWVHPGAGWLRRLIRQVAMLAVPALVTAPYTSAVSQVMRATDSRAGGDFAFATFHPFGPMDLVGALVFPPVCTVEGCFYAGILTVFLVILYLWRGQNVHEKLAVVLGIIGLLTLILGSRSFLFTLVWSFLPIVNRTRVFSRMTIALLPLLAIAIHQGFAVLSGDLDKTVDERVIRPRAVVTVLGTVFILQAFLYHLKDSFNQDYRTLQAVLMPAGTHETDFLMYTILTAGVLLFAVTFDWSKLRNGRVVLFAILTILVTQDAGTQGRFLWAQSLADVLKRSGLDPSSDQLGQGWALAKRNANFYPLIRDYFALERTGDAIGLTADGPTKVPMQTFDFLRYVQFYKKNEGSNELNQIMGKKKLFFHTSLHDRLADFWADANSRQDAADSPSVDYFDGNELRFSITTREPGYVSWIDNFDEGWKAEVDGVRSPIELSMTTFKAVRLAHPGQHGIRFVYRPVIAGFAYLLMALGVATLGSLAWWERRQHSNESRMPSAETSAGGQYRRP